jgi:ligand-binding SRPBCC domain-containing protein
MPTIEIITHINAPITRCFDLSRSIDLHKITMEGTGEEAIAGVTSGLIGKGERVTWRARHFGVTQTLTSQITQFDRPHHFRDEMIEGVFRMIRHDHFFESRSADKTIVKDIFQFESPGGIFGSIFNKMILENYLRDMLTRRNQIIRQVAESDAWKSLIGE